MALARLMAYLGLLAMLLFYALAYVFGFCFGLVILPCSFGLSFWLMFLDIAFGHCFLTLLGFRLVVHNVNL